VELTRHLVNQLHRFEFTHSFVIWVTKQTATLSLLELRSFAYAHC
jgi:hypothetical protein